MLENLFPFVIDTRIINENYRYHNLRARFYAEQYIGEIWKNNQKIAVYQGSDLDMITSNLRHLVDFLIDSHSFTK